MPSPGSVPCPGGCGGRIRLYVVGRRGHLRFLEGDAADVRRHALCMTPVDQAPANTPTPQATA